MEDESPAGKSRGMSAGAQKVMRWQARQVDANFLGAGRNIGGAVVNIEQGAFGFGHWNVHAKLVRLVALFAAQSGAHLLESPLSSDQTFQELSDGRLRLTATVPHTERLIWWLLSFGPFVKVEKPLALRREVASRLREGAAQYGEAAGNDADPGPATLS